MSSLKQKTIKGVFWSFISQGGKQVSQFVVTLILARLLLPSDFGLAAMATVFVNFAMIFSEMGISSALIQKQDTHDRHYYSAFWFNIIVGLCLTLVFIAVRKATICSANQQTWYCRLILIMRGYLAK